MSKKEVSAIIVARKGSIRVKNKSMQEISGKTLIQIKIEQLKKCENIDRVIFGSDAEEMLEHASLHGAEVIERPEYFCDESKASANEMIHNMCELVETDVVVWAHCTNPFITSQTYVAAINKFFEEKEFDSLLSVVKLQEHLWGTEKKPLNYNPYGEKHVPARNIPPYYMQDGGIFIQWHKNMLRNRYFFGEKPFLFEIPEDEFFDINNEKDLICARAIFEAFKKEN